MMRCIELASMGAGKVSPNPLVGCVIVKNGKVISEGYHKKYGALHAERDTITKAVKKGIELKGSALYVNLEPCSHFGKTPPCDELIIENRIKEVIIGTKDPFHMVSGKGIKTLRKAGIRVTVGVVEDECREMNRFFIKHASTGLPYVTIKTAQTLDGKIANLKFDSKWISSIESRRLVHAMRGVYDAVLVGSNTVKHDDPELTVRLVKGRNPYRIVIDEKLDGSLNRKLYTDSSRSNTILITSQLADKKKTVLLKKRGISVFTCGIKNGIIDIKDVLLKLGAMGISSIIVEGGAGTYNEFINKKLVDEFMIFTAPKVMGKGIEAFSKPLDLRKFGKGSYYISGGDIVMNFRKNP
jgi:diaminohydroxyphosphoribosylaminopyrimidine deaminase / 5-amino-6-(5-phosphoribosylamino)uracil reductase